MNMIDITHSPARDYAIVKKALVDKSPEARAAELIDGTTPHIDPQPYRVERF